MEFINLTPHTINIMNEAGEEVLSIPPSGKLARVAEQREQLGQLSGVEISRASYGTVEGLPDPQPGVAYIVSGLVLAACQDRPDVFAPGPAVRDSEGRVIGAQGLSASKAYIASTPESNSDMKLSSIVCGRQQSKRLLDALRAAGIEADDVKFNRRTGVFTIVFTPALTELYSPGTAPAQVWAERIATVFNDAEIVDTYDNVAEWRPCQPIIYARVRIRVKTQSA